MVFANRKSGNVGAGGGKRIKNISLAEDIAEIQHIARRQIVIEAQYELVVVGRFVEGGDKRVLAGVWQREVRKQILRNGIGRKRQLVIRNGLIGKFVKNLAVWIECAEGGGAQAACVELLRLSGGVFQGSANFAKIAVSFILRRNCGFAGFASAFAQPFVVQKEKCFVLFYRAAEGPTVLIALQWLDLGGKKAFGIEGVIAKKLPKRSVIGIGARASDDIGGGAGAMSKFRVGSVGENAEFGDGVHGRFHDESAIDVIEIVGAIDQKIVGFGTLTVDRVGLTVAQ